MDRLKINLDGYTLGLLSRKKGVRKYYVGFPQQQTFCLSGNENEVKF